MIKFWYTYVLKSASDGRLYIGCTSNLKNRLQEHLKGGVKSTEYRHPLKLIYFEACKNKYKALKREKYFKTGFGRRYLKIRV